MPAFNTRSSLLFLYLILVAVLPFPIRAVQNLTLQWDPNTEPDVVWYRLYFGSSSRSYSQIVQVAAPTTTATAPSLTEGLTYFFAVTAVNSSGLESGFSTEVSTTIAPTLANIPPTLNPLSTLVLAQSSGSTVVPLSGISSGSSTELQLLTVTATSNNPWLVPTPSISYSSPNGTGSLTLTPNAGMVGSATITVSVNDSQPLNSLVSRSFSVIINNAPTLNSLPNVSINQNASAQNVFLSGITSGAANEAQALQVTATSSNPWLIPAPTISYTSPNSTGVLAFQPVAGATGSAVISVTVNDGQAGNNTVTRSFSVTVNPAAVNNIAPTLSPIANRVVTENSGLSSVPLFGISSGSSTEIQPLTITAVSSNPALIPNPTVSYSSPNTTGILSFSPTVNASGSAMITVTVSDGQSVNGAISQSFVVTVNNPPTLSNLGDMVVAQNGPQQSVFLSGITSGGASEVQTLSVSVASSNPAVIPSPTVSYASPNSAGALFFQPAPGAVGSATITVTVYDGQPGNNAVSRSFNVTVNAVAPNIPPTLNAMANLVVTENSGTIALPLSGISSGSSNETQPLSITAASSNPALIPNPVIAYASPSTTGTLSFTPIANASGSGTITVTVSDGQSINGTISRSFVVTVNNAPTLNPLGNVTLPQNAALQVISLSGITSGAWSEIQPLQVTAVSSNPSVVPTPTVLYTSPNSTGSLLLQPLPGAVGTAVLTVTVSDGQPGNSTVSRSFSVTVNPAAPNIAPTLDPIGNVLLTQNAGTRFVPLTGISSGSSSEVQPLTVSATSSNPWLIPNPTVSYGSPATSGALFFTPSANMSGTATITVTVNDGQALNNLTTRSFTVTINNPPTLTAIPNMTIPVNATWQVISLNGISPGGVNEVQPLTVTASSSNTGLIGTPTVYYSSPNVSGALSFSTVPGASGTATITVTVKDGQSGNGVTSRAFVVTVGSGTGALSVLSASDETSSTDGDTVIADTGSSWGTQVPSDTGWTAETSSDSPIPPVEAPVSAESAQDPATSDASVAQPADPASIPEAPVEVAVASIQPEQSGPQFSDIVVYSSDARTLVLSWQTDKPATCFLAYGATTSLQWASDSSSGLTHTIRLANLEPATLYYLHPFAADDEGHITVGDVSTAQTPGVNVLSWPAEGAALVEPMAVAQETDAAGETYISTSSAGEGSATLNVQFPEGMTYRVWCRVQTAADAAFGVSVDGGSESTASIQAGSSDWRWVPLESPSGAFTFLANDGDHQVILRSFSTDTRLDKICISNDPEWRPIGFNAPLLTVSRVSGGTLLEWSDRWSNADGYVIESSNEGAEFQTLAAVGSAARSYLIQNSDAASAFYRVYAFTEVDRGALSATVTLAPSVDQCPDSPLNLAASVSGDGEVSLAWQNGSSSQTAVLIERSTDQINFSVVQTLAADATSATDAPPGAGKYFYRAKSVNSSAQSEPTDVIAVLF
jgi:hypothetical protein